MSRSMRASILQVAMLLIAAPVIAWADPGPIGNADPAQAPRVYADNDSVDCSKLDSDEAREKCREKKVDRRTDDVNVDCSQIKDDSARRRCIRAKAKN